MGAQFDGRGVVVTGGGSGIGQALAERMAAEGARVVVNDLDGAAAERVAATIGGSAVVGDAASSEGVRALVDNATEHLGRIDVFFANAGVGGSNSGDSLHDSEELWDRMLEVNVRAHIRAARYVIPSWLEDGKGGRFVVTASAAGLLTMLGSAPYSVSKHAAVAFAEWLSVNYAGVGIDVHAICPQGVRTPMLESAKQAKELLGRDQIIEPAAVADAFVQAAAERRFLVLPHAEVGRYFARKGADPERWLAGMRRLRLAQGTSR